LRAFQEGNSCLLSPGAPDTVRCGFLSFFGEADHWRFRAVGAPETVRCTLLTVGSATCRARITRPTVGPADCWLTGQSGAPPDSMVIYSRTSPMKSESSQLTDASLAHWTLSGAPPDSLVHPDCAESWLLSQVFSKLVFSGF
jgi:hypothetical protein